MKKMEKVRVFPKLPIAGFKGEKQEVYIDLTFDFEEFVIRAEHVFAYRDSETGEDTIPVDLAELVDEKVRQFAGFMRQQLANERERTDKVREISFKAPEPSPDLLAMV